MCRSGVVFLLHEMNVEVGPGCCDCVLSYKMRAKRPLRNSKKMLNVGKFVFFVDKILEVCPTGFTVLIQLQDRFVSSLSLTLMIIREPPHIRNRTEETETNTSPERS